MAVLNRSTTKTDLVTHEGAKAVPITPEQELRRTVMACLLWEQTFYESGVSVAERIAEGVKRVSLEVASQLAIEAREKMHLRHVPLLIVHEMSKKGGRIVGDTLARVIQRPDEITEFLAIHWKDKVSKSLGPSGRQIKRGLSLAFQKFNAYSIAKYDRAKDIRLRDVAFLCHAKAKDEDHGVLLARLVNKDHYPKNTKASNFPTQELYGLGDHVPLSSPDTWEVAISGGADKKGTFTRLLEEKKLGGLALLRNLRNMQEAGVDAGLVQASINEHKFSRVLPFHFISAANYAPMLEPELEKAMFRAIEGTPLLPGRTALLLDRSGSMDENLSAKSNLRRMDAAAGVGMLLREVCQDGFILSFAGSPSIIPPRRGFALRDAYFNSPSGGTRTDTAKLAADKIGYDRIIIITDEQSHESLSPPKAELAYVINVGTNKNGIGYGRWTHVDGWSEAVVKYIAAVEGVAEPVEETEEAGSV